MIFRSIVAILLSAAFLLSPFRTSGSQSSQPEDVTRVCFTGDVMLARGVDAMIKRRGMDFLFEKIRPVFLQYKYRFINLECPITKLSYPPNKPFCFRADSSFVGILTAAGVTHATLANNHIDDQTVAVAGDTYNILAENGIRAVGLREKEDQVCKPAEVSLGQRKLAVFGALGIDMKSSNIWYSRDSVFVNSVKTYKKENPSAFVLCYLHWGNEYRKFPSVDQVADARRLINIGADMIIGHHPHVIESIQYYKGKPIFFSLGNLIFDQHDPDTKRGIIVGLIFRDSSVETDIIPYDIKEDRPVPLSPEEKQGFKQSLLNISDEISLYDNDKGWRLNEKKPPSKDIDTVSESTFSPLRIKDAYFDGSAQLEKLSAMPGYRLKLNDRKTGITDNLYIPYPVYRFEAGDINNDGRTDVLLGVIKSTHFDPGIKKRLFIFRIDSSRLSPLWLGSRVCLGLVDFKPVAGRSGCGIMTVEEDLNHLYCNGLYRWDNFGLRLIGYKNENSNAATAYRYFDHTG